MPGKVPKNIFALGLVSFFNDIAGEAITPILPIFITTVLGAPVPVVGLIEGVSEATSSIMKFVAGFFSDKTHKRKNFIVLGYALTAVSKLLTGLATTWPFVLFCRFSDRLGKGIRTTTRDALILQSTDGTNNGFMFGFHRTMDSAGAVVGPLVGLILLAAFQNNYRFVFIASSIFSFLGVILLILFVKEKPFNPHTSSAALNFSFRSHHLDTKFKLFLIVSMIFALGSSADAFIILRAQQLGLTAKLVIAAYMLYNFFQASFSTSAGKLADRIGARRVFAYGMIIFSFVYFSFGIITKSYWIWLLFPIYGLYKAFTDGVSKAYISKFIDESESGTYFGIYQTGIAICTFLASFIGGILWYKISPSATFIFGSIMAGLAFLLMVYGKYYKKI